MLDPTEQMMLENLSKNSKNKELIEKFQIVEKNLHELSKLFLPASTSSVSIVATPSAGAMEAEKMLIYENNLKEVLQSVNALKNEYKNYGEYFDRLEEKLSKHQEIIDKLMGTYGSHTLPLLHFFPLLSFLFFAFFFIAFFFIFLSSSSFFSLLIKYPIFLLIF